MSFFFISSVKMIKILVLLVLLITRNNVESRLKCLESYNCVRLSDCGDEAYGQILYPCNDDRSYICCPQKISVGNTNNLSVISRTTAFPDSCGFVSSDDRITSGEIASIGQFPWMALLGYTHRALKLVQFLCGGSLITKEYVLTAAHCISIDPNLKLEIVRLGELNLETSKDCEFTGIEEICADAHIDVQIESIIGHQKYNNTSLENDIAIIKLKRQINFTEYVRPICLPFRNEINYKTIVNDKLTISGWGKTDSGNVAGSTKLMYAKVSVWDHNRCNISVPPRIRPIRSSQLCANGLKKQDACKGDSGGPLVNITLIDNDLRNYQIGIVSFASAKVCGNAELPTIYTRVDYYLDWIIEHVV